MVNCWIITEGMAGTENQCLGVAEALGIHADVKRMTLRQPWKMLSPYIPFEQSWSFVPALHGPFPDLLITSGRKAIAAARYIKKQNPKTFTLHLQDPRISPRNFDLVAVAHHDALRGDNVVVTDGAPNRITPERLSSAPPIYTSTKPLVGVLIGGNSKTHRLSDEGMDSLIQQLEMIARDYALLITVSRRTDASQARKLIDALKQTDAYIWDGSGHNPYFSILAHASYLLVTNDSVSMLSDAATTGKPLYMLELDGRSPKFDRFYAHFRNLGVARPFNGVLENWAYSPLADAQKIADAVRKASGLF